MGQGRPKCHISWQPFSLQPCQGEGEVCEAAGHDSLCPEPPHPCSAPCGRSQNVMEADCLPWRH